MTRGRPVGEPTSATIRSALRHSAQWTVPQWRKLRRDWSRALRTRPASEVIRLALELVQDSVWGRLTAYEILASHPGGIAALTPAAVARLGKGSADRWERRVAVVCTVALNVRARGGRGDAARTLAVCRQAVTDRDDMVVKALSWALRSLVEWDRDAVAGFLEAHGDHLAGRVKREVRTKLRTGRKN